METEDPRTYILNQLDKTSLDSPSEPPNTIRVGQTFKAKRDADIAIENHLRSHPDPNNEASKIQTAKLIANKLDMDFNYVYNNYDSITENMTGISNNPQGFKEYVQNQYSAGAIYIKQAKLWQELQENPKSGRRDAIMEEIKALDGEMPPLDRSEKGWFTKMAGGTANLFPYSWAVGKYMVAGTALALATKGVLGKSAIAEGAVIAAKLFSATGQALSFSESHGLAKGIIFGDLMEMKDTKGNPILEETASNVAEVVSIPYAITEVLSERLLLTGNSILRNALKRVTKGSLDKLLLRSAARTVNKIASTGLQKRVANNIMRVGGNVLATTAFGLTEEVFEETLQDTMQDIGNEYAKQITNELTDSGFLPITTKEYLSQMQDTITQTAQSVLLLQIPGIMRSAKSSYKSNQQQIRTQKSSEELEGKEAVSDIYANPNTDPETLAEVEQMDEDKLKIEEYERPVIKAVDNKITATTISGEEVGTATYTEKDNVIRLEAIDDMSDTTTERVMAEITKKFPNKQVVLSPDAIDNNLAARAVEDLNPELAVQNKSIAGARRTIEEATKFLDEYTQEKDIITESIKNSKDKEDRIELLDRLNEIEKTITEEEENISISEETIERATQAKAEVLKPKKEIKDMTPDEYIKEFPEKEEAHLKDIKVGKELGAKLQKLSNFNDEETAVSLDLVDMIARAKGMSPAQWLKDTFKEGVVAKQVKGEKRASADLTVPSQAIIKLAKESDFSSWVHELAHVFRQQLVGEDLKIATEWAKKETGDKATNDKWTRAMEEAFAQGFERYIAEGGRGLAVESVWDKMAKFMRKIYETLRDLKTLPELSPEIKQVFDNQLAPSRLKALKEGTTGLELFQPAHKAAIKEAIGKGLRVPRETLEALDEPWAKEEITRQETEKTMMEDFDFLVEEAKMSKDVEGFLEKVPLIMNEDVFKLDDKSEAWLRDFYGIATKEETTDINTGNKEWVAKVNESYSEQLVQAVSKDTSGADAVDMGSSIVRAARRFLSTKTVSPKMLSIITRTLKNNPSKYREMASSFMEDYDEMRKIETEKAFSEEIGIEEDIPVKKLKKERRDIAQELSDAQIQKMVQKGDLSSKKAEELMGDASEEIRSIEGTIEKLEKDIDNLEKKHDERLDSMIKSRNNELAQQAQKLKDALTKQKAELKDKEKVRKERKKARDYILKLGKQITKKVPATIDAHYRNMIYRLQGKVDPKFRQKAKLAERISMRETYEQNPGLAKSLPKGALNAINAKALNEWTALELEALKEKIDQLTYQGRMIKKIREAERVAKRDSDITTVSDQATKHGVFTEADISNGEAKTMKEKSLEYMLKTFRLNRIIDMLDAGKTVKGEQFDGPIYRIIWDGITKGYNNEIREKHRREVALKDKFIELKLKRSDLSKTVEVVGLKWSKDEILDVWAGWQNEKKRAILEDNMGITEEIHDELVSHLTENEIKLGQHILDDYTEAFERLQEAYYLDKNILLEGEENYSPIRVIIDGLTSEELNMSDQLMNRKSIRATIPKGMTEKRVKHDHKMQLGLLEAWTGAIAKEEHYINNVAPLKHINGVVRSKEFVSAIASVKKTPMLKEVHHWLDRYADPLANKSNKAWDRAIRALKKNAAVAYLWGNLSTIAKQIPSIAYFVAYSGPDFFTGLFSNYNETRALMDKWSPELTYGRSFEAFVDAIKSQATSQGMHYIRQMGAFGLKGIEIFDRQVITAGWRGVYENNRRHGLSEEESARKATQAVLLTQPASGIKDTAAIYADDNMLSMMLMFTNQLNQIFLNVFYDAPQALMHGRALKGMSIYMAAATGALALWMISNRRMPEDEEDWIDMGTDQFLNIIPGIGKIIGSSVDGYDLSIPALAPLEAMSAIFKLGKRAASGQDITKPQIERAMKNMYEGFAIGAGVPYTAVDRMYKGFQDGLSLETILFGGEFNDK